MCATMELGYCSSLKEDGSISDIGMKYSDLQFGARSYIVGNHFEERKTQDTDTCRDTETCSILAQTRMVADNLGLEWPGLGS